MTSSFSDNSRPDSRSAAYRERRSERLALSTKTRLTQQNWYTVEVVLRDLSSSGFMAQCDDNVPIGSYVALDVPGLGTVRAQVRWQLAGKMGGQFLDPIRLSQCEWTAVKAPAPEEAG